MRDDTISRAAALDSLADYIHNVDRVYSTGKLTHEDCMDAAHSVLDKLPSAQPDYQEVLGWLLAYHTKSFDLHGRYLPHEVISWLINDFTKEFIADRNEEE